MLFYCRDCENDKTGIFNNGVNFKKTLPPRSVSHVKVLH